MHNASTSDLFWAGRSFKKSKRNVTSHYSNMEWLISKRALGGMVRLWVIIKLIKYSLSITVAFLLNTVCQLLQHFYCSLAQVLMLINITFRQYLVKWLGYSTFQNSWEVNQNRQFYKVNKFDLFPYVKALLPSPWCNKLSQQIMISLPSSFHQKTVTFGNKSLTRSTALFHQTVSFSPF